MHLIHTHISFILILTYSGGRLPLFSLTHDSEGEEYDLGMEVFFLCVACMPAFLTRIQLLIFRTQAQVRPPHMHAMNQTDGPDTHVHV